MLRIIVMVLLAANLLYFGWSRWVRKEAPRLVAPAAATTATASGRTPASATACALLGPVADETRAMEVEQVLRDARLAPERHTVTTEVRNGWWVHVATADAAAQARTLRIIQDSGINDAFAMPDDPEFRVSVGLFSVESHARTRAAEVRALQLEPRVTERMARETRFWFELPGVSPAGFDLSRLAVEGIDTSSLQLEPCGEGGGTGTGGAPSARQQGAATSSGATAKAAV